jgi:hypothetical protein
MSKRKQLTNNKLPTHPRIKLQHYQHALLGEAKTVHFMSREIKAAFSDVKRSAQDLAVTATDLNESAKWFKL